MALVDTVEARAQQWEGKTTKTTEMAGMDGDDHDLEAEAEVEAEVHADQPEGVPERDV